MTDEVREQAFEESGYVHYDDNHRDEAFLEGFDAGRDVGYREGESAERKHCLETMDGMIHSHNNLIREARIEQTAEIVVTLREWAATCDPGSNERNALSYAADQLAGASPGQMGDTEVFNDY